jgi:hypothetical protein
MNEYYGEHIHDAMVSDPMHIIEGTVRYLKRVDHPTPPPSGRKLLEMSECRNRQLDLFCSKTTDMNYFLRNPKLSETWTIL